MAYFELPEDSVPRIQIEHVGSDLRLRGWERAAVSAEGDQAAITEQDDGTLLIHSSGDLDIRLPADSEVTIGSIGSDARVTGVSGMLWIGSVGSDLVLRKTGPVSVDAVGSDLRIKRVEGDVRAGSVGSDATIREVNGATIIGNVGSDLYVRDVIGPCEVEKAGSDLVLSTDFLPGAAYRFTVGGDIVCRVAPDADVRFHILDCDDLTVDAPGAEISEGEHGDVIEFGDGAAVVELRAGGEIRLVGQDEDYLMAINLQLEEDLQARLSGLEERLAEQLSGLDDLIESKADRLRQRAEQQAERALRKAQRSLRKAEQRAEPGKRKRSFTFAFGAGSPPRPPGPPRPPAPPEPREPVTDDERLLILRMLEQKQISVEEAEKLLAALEGR